MHAASWSLMRASLRSCLGRVAGQQLARGGNRADSRDRVGGGDLRVGLERVPRSGPPRRIVTSVGQARQPEELVEQLRRFGARLREAGTEP